MALSIFVTQFMGSPKQYLKSEAISIICLKVCRLYTINLGYQQYITEISRPHHRVTNLSRIFLILP